VISVGWREDGGVGLLSDFKRYGFLWTYELYFLYIGRGLRTRLFRIWVAYLGQGLFMCIV
jgi:hypothetical protein